MTIAAGTTQDLELDLLAETARRLTAQRDTALERVTEYGGAIAYLELAASAGGVVQIRRPGAATLLTTRVAAAAVDVMVAAPTLLECVERTRRVQVATTEGGSHRAAETGGAATTRITTAGAEAETQTCRQHPFPAPSVAPACTCAPALADAGEVGKVEREAHARLDRAIRLSLDGTRTAAGESLSAAHTAIRALAARAREAEGLRARIAAVDEHSEWTARTADERIAELRARVAELEADVKCAAGEYLIPCPEPGTDIARVLIGNRMPARERDAARDEARRLSARSMAQAHVDVALRDMDLDEEGATDA